jgi:hypothetical protein
MRPSSLRQHVDTRELPPTQPTNSAEAKNGEKGERDGEAADDLEYAPSLETGAATRCGRFDRQPVDGMSLSVLSHIPRRKHVWNVISCRPRRLIGPRFALGEGCLPSDFAEMW